MPAIQTEEKIEELYERLKELTNVDAAVKEAHIQNIERKYKGVAEPKPEPVTAPVTQSERVPDPELKSEAGLVSTPVNASGTSQETRPPQEIKTASESELICPKCGSKLILRTAKKGGNAGNQFYGCSAFPKCRYIENIE